MFWFIDDAARLQQERAAIDELLRTGPWLTGAAWKLDRNGAFVEADIEAHGSEFRVLMRYPTMFPAAPPSVRPRDPSEPRWSTHQYVNGELCLELGADTWLPEFTGAQMLESAHLLFDLEDPLAANEDGERTTAPSRHELTIGQELRSEPFRFVSTANLREHIKTLDAGIFDATLLYSVWQEKSYMLLVSEIRSSNGAWKDAAIPEQLAKFTAERIACVARLEAWQPAQAPRNMDELLGYVEPDLREPLRARLTDIAATYLLVVDRANKLHLINLPTETRGAFDVPELAGHENLSAARSGTGTIPADAKVGIVGLGSAGSKIAVSLGRSGVRNFVLVDDDILLPENLVRNDLDWRSVGEHKVDAVTNRLLLTAPDLNVEVRRTRLAGQESNTTSAGTLELLASCDVLIDATAEPAVLNLLGAVAEKAKRTLVWLEVFAGGFGGLVARYRPGNEPEPAYMRRALYAYCEETEEPPRTATGYGGIGEDGATHVATDAEVGILAEHAARFALDAVLKAEPSCFPYSMYLLGLRREWVFDAPYHTIPIDLSSVVVPEHPPDNAEERDAGLAFVRRLLDAMPND